MGLDLSKGGAGSCIVSWFDSNTPISIYTRRSQNAIILSWRWYKCFVPGECCRGRMSVLSQLLPFILARTPQEIHGKSKHEDDFCITGTRPIMTRIRARAGERLSTHLFVRHHITLYSLSKSQRLTFSCRPPLQGRDEATIQPLRLVF